MQPWAAPPARRSTAWIATAIGGGAAFVGAFLPWVHVVLFGTFDLFGLVGHGSGKSLLALLIIGGAVVVALIGLAQRSDPTAGVAAIVLTIAICGAVLTGVWGIALDANVREAAGFASLGIGPFVTIGGFILGAIGAGGTLSRLPSRTLPPGWYERRRGRMSWWDGHRWHDWAQPASAPKVGGDDLGQR